MIQSARFVPRPSTLSQMWRMMSYEPICSPLRDDRNVMMGGRYPCGIPSMLEHKEHPLRIDRLYPHPSERRGDDLAFDGRPLMANRDKWQFYTMNNNIKLPIVNRGKSCTNEYGCDNLYNGDSVYVEGIKDAFNVTDMIMLLHGIFHSTWLVVVNRTIWIIN